MATKGVVRINTNAGTGAALAREIKTPEWEYKLAIEKKIEFPAAGLPDYDGIEERFGLTRDMLSEGYRHGCRI